jgi:periplasmic divalent cation tolerance protein
MTIESFYITFPDKITATQISNACITGKLAACSNIFPIESLYVWNSEMQNDQEYAAILKTSCQKVADLEKYIESQHPYDVPCIAHHQVQVNDAYGKWVEDFLK